MDIQLLIVFFLLTLVAEIVGTVGGFGSSVFFVPIAGYFLDFHSVLGITVIFHIISNISKILFFREGIDKRTLLLVGIPSVILGIVGAYFSSTVDSSLLQFILACFLIVLSLLFLIKKNIAVKPSVFNGVVGGAASGFIAGLVGTGGAIRGITLAAFNLEKKMFIATSALIDLFVDMARSVVYITNGFVHGHDLYLIPVLLVAAVAGTWIGKQIVLRIPQENFRTIVLVSILVVGILSIFQSDFISVSIISR
ncbi:MAG: sulfite exporter TauE/SafE family protein [Flavobacteriales bacterium]|nr:sulfite exporter TauE/SafE family protein [Flavobacteriales bacterium]